MPNIHLLTNSQILSQGEILTLPLHFFDFTFELRNGMEISIGTWPSKPLGSAQMFSSEVLSIDQSKSESGQVSKFVQLRLLKEFSLQHSAVEIELLVAIPRPQILKRLLESLACFHISRLILFPSEKSQKSYLGSKVLDAENCEKHLLIGAMQAGFSFRPEVVKLNKFQELRNVSSLSTSDSCLLADADSNRYISDLFCFTNEDTCSQESRTRYKVVLAIGPEAGWSSEEKLFFENNGFKGVKLTESILRVDTAAMVACAQLFLSKGVKKSDQA